MALTLGDGESSMKANDELIAALAKLTAANPGITLEWLRTSVKSS